jgi:hypothetical protein
MLQREVTGVVILQASEHLWPEDIERAIPVFHAPHGVGRNQVHPLLLLVRLTTDFVGSERGLLRQILEPEVLPRNRSCQIAFLNEDVGHQETERLLERNSRIEIRYFGATRSMRLNSGFSRRQEPVHFLRSSGKL